MLEKFNEMKNKLEGILKEIPISSENINELDDTQNAVAHSIDEFISKCPIREREETKMLLDRFAGNYPYLELYRGMSLQGVVVIDYALSKITRFLSTVDVSSIINNMLPKLWDKEEPIDQWQNRIGYYGFIQNLLLMQSLCSASSDEFISMIDLLSTHLYPFNIPNLTKRLQKEDTFSKQQRVTLDALDARAGLIENIMSFENYSQKNENLLQHVFGYLKNHHFTLNIQSINVNFFLCDLPPGIR